MLTQSQRKPGGTYVGFSVNDLAMIAVVVIWAGNFSFIKVSLEQIPPLAFAAIRFTVATMLLWVWMRWREGVVPLPAGNLWKLTWIGVIGNTIYQILFTYGLSMTTAANGSLFLASVPAIVALGGALWGIERLTRNISFGVILAFIGVVLVLLVRGVALSSLTVKGDLLIIACAVAWAIYTLGVRTVSPQISPLRITLITMITGVPGLILVSIPDLLRTRWAEVTLSAWGGLAYATILGLIVAYALWNNSIRMVGSNRTAIYGCAIPLVTALIAWPVLHEQPTLIQGVGAVLIIAGVLLSRKGENPLRFRQDRNS